MQLTIQPKDSLSPAQLALVAERLALPEHQHDEGPSRAWHGYSSGLYAFFDDGSGRLVALVEVAAGPVARPGWWIDQAFRGQGHGRAVMDLLAAQLKANGVTSIGWVMFASHKQQYDARSARLLARLRRHFEPVPD